MTRRHHAALIALIILASACSSGSSSSGEPSSTTSATSASAATPGNVCRGQRQPPEQYRSVVVFAFENRTWSEVGRGFGPRMPYLHALGRQCAYFSDWSETDPDQSSLTQYVGQMTGARERGTVDDCDPSARCSTRSDNVFRQLRRSGRLGINFVEGASEPCSADGNAVRHVPPLYFRDPEDRAHCREEVRPLRELDVDALPAFAFITPNECNDGHDCENRRVDSWARDHVQPVLDSDAYRKGQVAVFIWYDEDRPVPNLWITPTATPGPLSVPGAGASGALRAWESMLGLECLADACTAPDLRVAANS